MIKQTFYNLPETKRERIYQAIKTEFDRVPLDKISINSIIKEANISRGSFYQYFENKQDLFEYIMTSKTGDMEKNLIEMIEQENGNIINIFINIYDHLIEVGKIRRNNKLFRQIFENIKTSDNLMLTRKEEMNKKLEKILQDLYSKNKDILNIKNEEEFKLVIEILSAITRRRIVASLKYKNSAEAREDFLKEIEYIKRGILK